MIFGFARKKNIFLLQHYHPIRHIHCQVAASEFPTEFDSWDMLTIIGSRSPGIPKMARIHGCHVTSREEMLFMKYEHYGKCKGSFKDSQRKCKY